MKESSITSHLRSLADKKYQEFSSALVPGSENCMIGVRVPQLRDYAKQLSAGDWRTTIDEVLSDDIFEERMLRGMILGYAKMDEEEFYERLPQFVKRINNWSVCDCACSTFRKKVNKNPERMLSFILPYMRSAEEFDQRFAAVVLLDFFVTTEFIDETIVRLCSIITRGYYAQMAVAWAISVCFVKFPEKTLPVLLTNKLDPTTHNMAVRKIIESRRTPPEMLCVVRSMKARND